jgi:hypothetical protein
VAHAEILELDPPLGFAVRKIDGGVSHPARIDDALMVQTRVDEARGARLASPNDPATARRLIDRAGRGGLHRSGRPAQAFPATHARGGAPTCLRRRTILKPPQSRFSLNRVHKPGFPGLA